MMTPGVLEQEEFLATENSQNLGGDLENKTTETLENKDLIMGKPKIKAEKEDLKVPETLGASEQEELSTTKNSQKPGSDMENKTTETSALTDCCSPISFKTTQSQVKVRSFQKTPKLEITPIDVNNLDAILKRYQITITSEDKHKILKPFQTSPKLDSNLEGSNGSVHMSVDSAEEESR